MNISEKVSFYIGTCDHIKFTSTDFMLINSNSKSVMLRPSAQRDLSKVKIVLLCG